MTIFDLPQYSLWLIAAAALTGLEMLTGTFYVLLMAIAALAGCAAALKGFSFEQQLLVFGAFALVEAIGFTLYRRRHPAKQTENFLDVGNQVVFKNTTPDGSWVVRYRGSDWQARPAREETRKDAPLVITKAAGNILIVDNPSENAN